LYNFETVHTCQEEPAVFGVYDDKWVSSHTVTLSQELLDKVGSYLRKQGARLGRMPARQPSSRQGPDYNHDFRAQGQVDLLLGGVRALIRRPAGSEGGRGSVPKQG